MNRERTHFDSHFQEADSRKNLILPEQPLKHFESDVEFTFKDSSHLISNETNEEELRGQASPELTILDKKVEPFTKVNSFVDPETKLAAEMNKINSEESFDKQLQKENKQISFYTIKEEELEYLSKVSTDEIETIPRTNSIDCLEGRTSKTEKKLSMQLETEELDSQDQIWNREKTVSGIATKTHLELERLITEFFKMERTLQDFRDKNKVLHYEIDILKKKWDKEQNDRAEILKGQLELSEQNYDKKVRFLQNMIRKVNSEKKEMEGNLDNINKEMLRKTKLVKELEREKPFIKSLMGKQHDLEHSISKINKMGILNSQNKEILMEKFENSEKKINDLEIHLQKYSKMEKEFFVELDKRNGAFGALKSKYEGLQIMLESKNARIRNFREMIHENDKMLKNYTIRYNYRPIGTFN